MYYIEVKDVRLNKDEGSNIKCNFTVVFNDNIEVHGCKLIISDKFKQGFVTMPSFKFRDKYFNYVVLSDSIVDKVYDKIMDVYNSKIS